MSLGKIDIGTKVTLTFILTLILIVSGAFATIELRDLVGNNLTSAYLQAFPSQQINLTYRVCALSDESSINQFAFGKFSSTFSENPIQNLTAGSCKQIIANWTIPPNTPSGNYSHTLVAVAPDDSKQANITITALPNTAWSVEPSNLSLISLTTLFRQDNAVIRNTGNSAINLTIALAGDTSFFWVSNESIFLEPQHTRILPIFWIVLNTSVASRIASVNFTNSDGNSRTISLNLSVKDNIPPFIGSIRIVPQAVHSYEPLIIVADAVDNDRVARVEITIDGLSKNATVDAENSTRWVFTNPGIAGSGSHDAIIRAVDASANEFQKSFSLLIQKRTIGMFSTELHFGRIKAGSSRILQLGITSIPSNLTFSLSRLSLTQNTTVNLTVNGIALPAVFTSFSGPFLLNLSSQAFTDFNGALKIATEESNDAPAEISIDGSFSSYSVGLDKTLKTPVTNSQGMLAEANTTCKGFDVGYFENSTYICTTTFPADISEGQLFVVSTVTAIEDTHKAAALKESLLQQQKNDAEFQRNAILLLLAVGGVVYILWIKVFSKMVTAG